MVPLDDKQIETNKLVVLDRHLSLVSVNEYPTKTMSEGIGIANLPNQVSFSLSHVYLYLIFCVET